jgi:hypothetical protein
MLLENTTLKVNREHKTEDETNIRRTTPKKMSTCLTGKVVSHLVFVDEENLVPSTNKRRHFGGPLELGLANQQMLCNAKTSTSAQHHRRHRQQESTPPPPTHCY